MQHKSEHDGKTGLLSLVVVMVQWSLGKKGASHALRILGKGVAGALVACQYQHELSKTGYSLFTTSRSADKTDLSWDARVGAWFYVFTEVATHANKPLDRCKS